MTREEATTKVLDYVYGELAPAAAREFEALLAIDEALRAEVAEVTEVRRAAAAMPRVELPRDLRHVLMAAAKRRTAARRRARSGVSALIERFFLSPAFSAGLLVVVVASAGAHLLGRFDLDRPLVTLEGIERSEAFRRSRQAEVASKAPPAERAQATAEAAGPAAVVAAPAAAPGKMVEAGDANRLARDGKVAAGGKTTVTMTTSLARHEATGRFAEPPPAKAGAAADASHASAVVDKVAETRMPAGSAPGTAEKRQAGPSDLGGLGLLGGEGAGHGGGGAVGRGAVGVVASAPMAEEAVSGERGAKRKAEKEVAPVAQSAPMPTAAAQAVVGVPAAPVTTSAPARAPASASMAAKPKADLRPEADEKEAAPAEALARARRARTDGRLADALALYERALPGLQGAVLKDALREAADVAGRLGRDSVKKAFLDRLDANPK